MAILTESGRTSVAYYLSLQNIHMAWGNGNASWDDEPERNDPSDTALVSEVGRLKATRVQFVNPDPAGAIELPEGRFTLSVDPTKYLYLEFDFSYQHAIGEVIREASVFLGTTLKEGVSPSTAYLTPLQIENQGRMLVAERFGKFTRQANVRQKFSYVIQF